MDAGRAMQELLPSYNVTQHNKELSGYVTLTRPALIFRWRQFKV
jgi:hypothetical protein